MLPDSNDLTATEKLLWNAYVASKSPFKVERGFSVFEMSCHLQLHCKVASRHFKTFWLCMVMMHVRVHCGHTGVFSEIPMHPIMCETFRSHMGSGCLVLCKNIEIDQLSILFWKKAQENESWRSPEFVLRKWQILWHIPKYVLYSLWIQNPVCTCRASHYAEIEQFGFKIENIQYRK